LIPISRSLARQLRAVFRRLAGRSAPIHPVLSLHAGKDGIRIRLHNADIAAEFHQAGSYAEEVLTLPLAALANFEGRTDALVELETARPGVTLARWQDSGVPQVKGYDSQELDSLAKFPGLPEPVTSIEPGFVKALDDASHSASSAIRYATDHIQLRGSPGQVIATDGHQLLLQSGFQFPFSEDVLILNTTVFGCRELDADAGVRIGKTATHVALRIGSWTLHLPINPDGRFPQAEQIVPSPSAALIHWRIDAADAAFLAKTLPKLPGGGDEDSAVTVDLNGQAAIRAKAEGEGPVTELILARSQLTGPPARFRIDRLLLARAVHLGFREVALVNGDSPHPVQGRAPAVRRYALGQGFGSPAQQECASYRVHPGRVAFQTAPARKEKYYSGRITSPHGHQR
jgi:hypothetical protein